MRSFCTCHKAGLLSTSMCTVPSRALDGCAEGEEGQGKRKKAAPRFSAEDKQLAVDAHRVHLLCLLSRALAMDQAASDPVVQASTLASGK